VLCVVCCVRVFFFSMFLSCPCGVQLRSEMNKVCGMLRGNCAVCVRPTRKARLGEVRISQDNIMESLHWCFIVCTNFLDVNDFGTSILDLKYIIRLFE